MKQKLLKLFILFITMSVLTSSRETGLSTVSKCTSDATVCPMPANDLAVNLPTCKEAAISTAALEEERLLREADNEISLSPISRFILLQ